MEQATAWEGPIEAGRSRPHLERLGEWFTAEYDNLLRFAFLISGDLATAEDLVHEAFVRLYRADRKIELAGFPAYARRTILNLQRSAFRRLRVERRVIASQGPERTAEPRSPSHTCGRRSSNYRDSNGRASCSAFTRG